MARRARGVLADVQMIKHAEIPKVTHVREMLLIKLHPSRRSSPPSPSVRLRWAPCAWHLYLHIVVGEALGVAVGWCARECVTRCVTVSV